MGNHHSHSHHQQKYIISPSSNKINYNGKRNKKNSNGDSEFDEMDHGNMNVKKQKSKLIKTKSSSRKSTGSIPNKNQPQKLLPSRPSEGAIKTIITNGSSLLIASQAINNNNLEKLAKRLAALSCSERISKEVLRKYLFQQSSLTSKHLWNFFTGYSPSNSIPISEAQFVRAGEKVYAQITDKDQIKFYFTVFSRGKDTMTKDNFKELLLSSLQLSLVVSKLGTTNTLEPNELCGILYVEKNLDYLKENGWVEAVTKSCFHIKEEMSIVFLCNWMETNLPRLIAPIHKYVIHQLTTGYTQLMTTGANGMGQCNRLPCLESPVSISSNGTMESEERFTSDDDDLDSVPRLKELVPGVHPVLLWFLTCTLPPGYISSLVAKPEPKPCPFTTVINPKQLLRELLSINMDPEYWTMLYDSDDHGTSINRFQFHVYNYKGPTLMFISADNGYEIVIGTDTEWKESCHFWGEDESVLVQLQPEFRVIERGPKTIFANFSIRGYPFGIRVGHDPKNVSLEIKPDFEYFNFKKIPCRITKLVVYGCAPKQTKNNQNEYKKWEVKECEKLRVVKRSKAEWDDHPDKYLLEMAGAYKSYHHNQQGS